MSAVMFTACEKEDSSESQSYLKLNDKFPVKEAKNPTLKAEGDVMITSKSELLALNLGQDYNIPVDIYQEFVDSIIFENEFIRGALYKTVDDLLTYNESESFWGNFGVSIRNNLPQPDPGLAGPAIFQGYKPKLGGCKGSNRWICVIRDYLLDPSVDF